MRKISLYLFYVAVICLALPLTKLQAAPFDSPYKINPTEPSAGQSFASLNTSIIYNVILFGVGAGATLYIIIGSIKYITAGGDDTKTAAARKTIINACIGVIIAATMWVIIGTVRNLF